MNTRIEARRTTPWLPIGSLYLAGMLQGLTLVSFPASSAVLKQMHGFSDAQYGAIFLPQVAFAVIGALGGGALAARLGLKTLLCAALLINAVSQLLLAGSMLLPLVVLSLAVVVLGLWPSLMNWLTEPAGAVLAALFLSANSRFIPFALAFAGGVIATANHVAGICGNVDILTSLGDDAPSEALIADSLKRNVGLDHLRRRRAAARRSASTTR